MIVCLANDLPYINAPNYATVILCVIICTGIEFGLSSLVSPGRYPVYNNGKVFIQGNYCRMLHHWNDVGTLSRPRWN